MSSTVDALVVVHMGVRNWRVRGRRRYFAHWVRKHKWPAGSYRLWESMMYGGNL